LGRRPVILVYVWNASSITGEEGGGGLWKFIILKGGGGMKKYFERMRCHEKFTMSLEISSAAPPLALIMTAPLLILWCSFKLWWNFCLDQNFSYKVKGPLIKGSLVL
jgi:hypothetical protein